MGKILSLEEALRDPRGRTDAGILVGGVFRFRFFDRFGNLKDEDLVPWHNLVTSEGVQHIANTIFGGGSQITTWYLGLTDSSPTPAAGDTLASHGGWTEFDEYTGNRKEFVEAVAAGVADNTSNVATFTFNAGGTVGGGFLCSAETGTSGTLMSVGARSGGDRTVESGESMEVSYTFTVADDGA